MENQKQLIEPNLKEEEKGVISAIAYTNPEKIPWSCIIKKSKKITIWCKHFGMFQREKESFEKVLNQTDSLVRFIFPDMRDSKLMKALKKDNTPYYDDEKWPPSELINLTIETIKSFSVGKGTLQIFLTKQLIHYPCFVFEDYYLFGIHQFQKTTVITTPTIQMPISDVILEQAEILIKTCGNPFYEKNSKVLKSQNSALIISSAIMDY